MLHWWLCWLPHQARPLANPLINKWVLRINRLSAFAHRFPHLAYAGLVSCLSAEWQYICRVIPEIGPLLAPVKAALHTQFLPGVLGQPNPIDDDLRRLLSLCIKQGGLAIRNPVDGTDALFQCSTAAIETLVHSLLHNTTLDLENDQNCICSAGASHCKMWQEANKAFQTALMASAAPKVRKRMEHLGDTGTLLTTIPDRFSGTELSKTEWHDNMSLHYGWHPLALPDHCNGCGKGFTVEHELNCKKGGLVAICHDDAQDKWAHLCSLSLSSTQVTVKPTIFYGGDMSAGNPREHPSDGRRHLGNEARGNVLTHGFWQCARGTVFDIRLCDMDARAYGNIDSSKTLKHAASEKKRKYEAPCLKSRWDSLPWSTQSTASHPRTHVLPRNASPAYFTKSGTKHTPRWSASSGLE
ncbi:hypothetical protein ACHAW6_003615 [Cyclotella cf. meneghiniana]